MRSIASIEQNICTGCGACRAACHIGAIQMVQDIEGFLYPIVDTNLCVFCGTCLKVCPVKTEITQAAIPEKCYSARLKDEKLLLHSSSGGAFPSIVKILGDKCVVFGVKYTSSLEVMHDWALGKDAFVFQGSKYVQSNMENVYEKVRNFLEASEQVFFTGTPCQVAGLKLFLKKEYDNLLCAELICHGVSSPGVFKSYLDALVQKEHTQIVSFNFRDKRIQSGGENFYTTFTTDDGKIKGSRYDLFTCAFLNNILLRPACFNCKFRSRSRCADIVLGDFWGIKEIDPKQYSNKGVSLIVPITLKGISVVEKLKQIMDMHEFIIEDALKYNKQFLNQTNKTVLRDHFFKSYLSLNVIDALKANVYLPPIWKRLVLYFVEYIKTKITG